MNFRFLEIDQETTNLRPFARFLMIAALLAPAMQGQQNFWSTPEAYLGQAPPSDTPKVFAPGLLTEKGMFVMGRVAFSRDGKEFYYAQNDSWESGEHAKMMVLRYSDHRWNKPVVLNERFLSPTLSLDDKTLYMRRIVKGASMKNVWRSERTGDGWGAPVAFLEESYGVYDYMPTAGGNAYMGSDPSAEDAKDGITYAYSVLTVSNGVPTVKSLGRPLNEPGFNGDLYIAPDESYMIVSAKETKDYESQLYISFRKHDSTWTIPVSLGSKINDGLAHRWGQYVTPDGKYLFYTHGTSEKDCTIYWVRFNGLLKSLRPKQL
jgi:hypothetical protein